MIILGRFREIYKDEALPSIYDYISDVPCANKEKILRYLQSKKRITSASPARLTDVISKNPIERELTCSNDGRYGWRSDVVYYFDKYNLSLPDDFIKHALA